MPAVRRQQGVALVLVLSVVALMTIMASSFTLGMRRELDLVRNARDLARARALAEGGIHYASLRLIVRDPAQRWRGDGTVYEWRLGDGEVRIQLFDEIGKANLNGADEKLLLGLMANIGLDEETARRLVDAILDWRDKDDLHRLNGAEKSDYEDAGLSYGPRNEPFRSLEEIQLVLGMTPEIYQDLVPLVTVYSDRKGIDPTKASRKVLLSLPGVDPVMVDEYLARRAESAENGTPPPAFPGAAGVPLSGGGGAVYTVRAEARLENGNGATVVAVVKKQPSRQHLPFSILSWKHRFGKEQSLFTEGAAGQGSAPKSGESS